MSGTRRSRRRSPDKVAKPANIREDEPVLREIDPAEWRRKVTEVLSEAHEPLTLDDIKERAGSKLDAPAPAALEEQMQSLLRLGQIERVANDSAYRITESGRWLAEGQKAIHGTT